MDKLILVDGYVDEPSAFGVPPYISPHVRYAAGAAMAAGAEVEYLTIDQWRRNPRPLEGDALAILASCSVPGKYLRGAPITHQETVRLFRGFQGDRILFGDNAAFGFGDQGGGHQTTRVEPLRDHVDHLATRHGDAVIRDLFEGRTVQNRFRTSDEWEEHAALGASVVSQHPDHHLGIVFAEMDTFYGCVHYVSGGCGFCSDAKTKPWYRDEEGIIKEAEVLYDNGVRHFRLGGQTCFWTYKAHGVGQTDEPRPNVEATERMLAGIHEVAPARKVLHIDNANPAVMATHPDESRAIARLLVEHGTDGNIAAMGLESADPVVYEANNLNCTPEQVMESVRILHEESGHRGPGGLPYLLGGINLLYGLPGETAQTYDHNWRFVEGLRKSGYGVRRIQIRQLLPIRGQKVAVNPKLAKRFKQQKEKIRHEVDRPLLQEVAPAGTILKDVFLEAYEDGVTWGRQIASYALLVGIPYELPLEQMTDVMITDHGFRSLTGMALPFDVSNASLKELQALPGVGKKRATTIKVGRPQDFEAFEALVEDKAVSEPLRPYLRFGQ